MYSVLLSFKPSVGTHFIAPPETETLCLDWNSVNLFNEIYTLIVFTNRFVFIRSIILVPLWTSLYLTECFPWHFPILNLIHVIGFLVLEMYFYHYYCYRYQHLYCVWGCVAGGVGVPYVQSYWQFPSLALLLLLYNSNFFLGMACQGKNFFPINVLINLSKTCRDFLVIFTAWHGCFCWGF